MKRTMLVLAAALLVGSLAHAADAEKKDDATVDTSKNPITGTVTTTKKSKKHMKSAHGDAKMDVTEKTKVHKNGKVEKSATVDAKATQDAPAETK